MTLNILDIPGRGGLKNAEKGGKVSCIVYMFLDKKLIIFGIDLFLKVIGYHICRSCFKNHELDPLNQWFST